MKCTGKKTGFVNWNYYLSSSQKDLVWHTPSFKPYLSRNHDSQNMQCSRQINVFSCLICFDIVYFLISSQLVSTKLSFHCLWSDPGSLLPLGLYSLISLTILLVFMSLHVSWLFHSGFLFLMQLYIVHTLHSSLIPFLRLQTNLFLFYNLCYYCYFCIFHHYFYCILSNFILI